MPAFASLYFWLLSSVSVAGLRSLRRTAAFELVMAAVNLFFLYLFLDRSWQRILFYLLLASGVWCAAWSIKGLRAQLLRRGALAAVITLLVAMMIYNKRSGHFIFSQENIQQNLPTSSQELSWFLLIGLSYFTFKVIHYLCDVVSGDIVEPSYLRFINFCFFFPAFVSGPMDRFNRFSKNIEETKLKSTDSLEWSESLFRIAVGAFKKFVLATLVLKYTFHQLSLGQITALNPGEILLGAYAFTLLIYFDFSGYSDMALGLAGLFGIRLPENFHFPLSSTSIQEFWTRWHITLSFWIRDYLVNPLFILFSKTKANATFLFCFCVVIAFLLCGAWHGLESHYLIWGFLNGLGLAIHLIFKTLMKRISSEGYQRMKVTPPYQFLSWFLTFHFVVFTLVFFSVESEKLPAVAAAVFK